MGSSNTSTRPGSPRLLHRLGLALAALLFLVVILAPVVDNGEEQNDGVGLVIALFARDVVLRQTTIASAVGLIVTASVFFRTPTVARRPVPKEPPRQPPTKIIGA